MSSEDVGAGVVVTLRDIYAQVIGLSVKVDVLLAQHVDQSKDIADHESRIRGLERNRWPWHAIAVLIAIAALIVSVAKAL